ncbi:hypothetical protein Nit79A3_1616 [Nitrosomonas sp. Is79A3]
MHSLAVVTIYRVFYKFLGLNQSFPKELLKYSSYRRKPVPSSLILPDSGFRPNDTFQIIQRFPKSIIYVILVGLIPIHTNYPERDLGWRQNIHPVAASIP